MSRATVLFRGTGGGVVSEDAPVGTVTNQRVDTGGNKWLPCDGSLVDTTSYPELATALADIPGYPDDIDWNVVTGVGSIPNSGQGCAFSPDGSLLAVGHSDSPFLTIINTSGWSVVSDTPILADAGRACAFSPDGSLLAVAHSTTPFLTVINTTNWTEISGITPLPSTGFGCAFSPDGSLLAVAHNDSPFITVLNTSNWTEVSGIPTLPGAGQGCDFSPNGAFLGTTHTATPFTTVISANTSPTGVELPSHNAADRLVAEIPIKIKALP